MNEVDKAWLAGFIDGEGCLTILRSTRKRKNRNYVEYTPVLVISNTDIEVLKYIQQLCGYGRIYDREHIFPNAKLQHSLHIYRINNILELCRKLLPYLFLKQKQAKILIEACQSTTKRPQLYKEIHVLNNKGEN